MLPNEVKVTAVEGSTTLQCLPVENGHDLVLSGEQPIGAKLLEAAVDVYGGKAERLTELGLRQGEGEAVVGDKPCDLEPGIELADQVRDLFWSEASLTLGRC